MNLAPQSTPTSKDIKTSFPFPIFDKILGELNYESFRKLEI